MKLYQYIILAISILSLNAKAQFIPDYQKAADLYFQKGEYYAAAEFYKKALNISSDSANLSAPYNFNISNKSNKKKNDNQQQMIFNLAESYRNYKDFSNAEKWYAVAKNFSDDKYVLSHFWYAEALRANNKYTDAISAFEKFLEVYPKNDDGYKAKAKQEIESCKFAIHEMKHPRLVTLKRLPAPVNLKEGSNYAPVKQNNIFYFTSSRPIGSSGKRQTLRAGSTVVRKKESPYVNAIYTTAGTNLTEASETKNTDKLEFNMPNAEYATIALTPDGSRAFFTAWNKKGENVVYNIYSAVKTNDSWSDPEPAGIQINIPGHNSMQPFITSDGKYLLFSSDRPGGLGKYDIWFAPLRANGALGQAINLGSKINTEEDEQAPYYNIKEEKLLFSSNGRVGLGGFDFYESKGDLSEWTEPHNLGFPFNSAKDDLYFTSIDEKGYEGYISSDRESLCCLELFHVKREFVNIKGTVTDCETGKPISGVKVTLTDSLTQKTKELNPENGIYSFLMDAPRPVKITIEKDGYFTKTQRYSAGDLIKADTLLSADLCLTPLVIDKPIVLKDIYYEFNSSELTPMSQHSLDLLAELMADNPNITIELSSHTDGIGSDAYNLDLSQRRAQSCVNYLISKGINPDNIYAKGYGKSRPIAPNTINGKDNPEGRQLNRRTEFKVLKK